MKKYLIVGAILILISTTAYADSEIDSTSLKFIKIIGMDKQIDNLRQKSELNAKASIKIMVDQIQKSSPDMNLKILEEVEKAANEMVFSIINSWDTNKAMLIYSEELSKGFSKDRLEKALEYYESPSRKHELRTINNATIKTYEYISQEIQNSMAIATKKYIEEVKSIFNRHYK